MKNTVKTPVYNLKVGDVFVWPDGRSWTIEQIIAPDNSLGEINTPPKSYQIKAYSGTFTRTFYPQTLCFS